MFADSDQKMCGTIVSVRKPDIYNKQINMPTVTEVINIFEKNPMLLCSEYQ